MPFRICCLLLSLTAAASSHAAPLDDVRRVLGELRGATPLKVNIHFSVSDGEGKRTTSRAGVSVAEDDGTFIRMIHDKKTLKRSEEERRGADHAVTAAEALELMNFAPALLEMLDGATLKSMTRTALNGVPAALLEIVPLRKKDEDGDKWVKSFSDTVQLWVDGHGVPLAAKRRTNVKGRIVVIGFEFAKQDDFRFVREADRLVVAKRTTETSGSGFGQKQDETKTTTVSPLH